LTEDQFNLVRPLLKISEQRIQAAYLVMVEGYTISKVSRDFGWPRQSLHKSILVVWETYQANEDAFLKASMAKRITLLPPGWQEVTIIAPADMIERFRKAIDDCTNIESTIINSDSQLNGD